jgi:hypothetical protein
MKTSELDINECVPAASAETSVPDSKSAKQRQKLGTVLLAGGVQVLDYFSDVGVVVQWFLEGQNTLAYIAIVFMILSITGSAIGSFYYLFTKPGWGPSSGYSLSARLLLFFILPTTNLHILFAGITMDRNDQNHRACFFTAKGHETVYEALPVSVLTIRYLSTTDPSLRRSSTTLLMISSLVLSCASMAYGLASNCVDENKVKGFGNALRIFCWLVVDIVWMMSGCWGLFSTGQDIVLLCVLGIQLACAVCLDIKMYRVFKNLGWKMYHIFGFYFLTILAFATFDPNPRNSWIPGRDAHFVFLPTLIIRRGCLLAMSIFSLTAMRAEIWLWFILAFGVCLHTFLTIWTYCLDEVCFETMQKRFSIFRPLVACLPCMQPSQQQQAECTDEQPSVWVSVVQATNRAAKVHTCLQELVLHDAWAEERVKRFVDVAEGVLRTKTIKRCSLASSAVEKLVDMVTQEIRQNYADGLLSNLLEQSFEVLCSYEPLEASNVVLRSSIQRVMDAHGFQVDLGCPSAPPPPSSGLEDLSAMSSQETKTHSQSPLSKHPALGSQAEQDAFDELDALTLNMRALPLVHAANVWLWRSAAGRPEQYLLSQNVEECATFVSHSWQDPWWTKATMLRNHLFLREYDGAVLILGFIGCIQAVLVAFLLYNVLDPVVAWFPAYIVVFCMMCASARGHLSGWMIPSTWGPWPTELDSDNGVWLDKVCIDQKNNETKQAGIANLGKYLLRCKTMTVMLGDTYLTRLWTTFELATYCKVHEFHLKDCLFFISLKWAYTWNIMWLFRQVELNNRELAQLTTFSCLDAECYMPVDRVVVLCTIRKTWGSEENFDHFVRTQLPEVLRRGKEEFMWRTFRTMFNVFEMLF